MKPKCIGATFSTPSKRGLASVRLLVSDSHAGLWVAREARFPGLPWQCCQLHLQQNASQYVPKQTLKAEGAAELRAVFDVPDRRESERRTLGLADKHRQSVPKLAEWLEQNVPVGLTVSALPAEHRRRLRTSNLLERINRELKRRTRVATLFPHEASLLRPVSAVLVEISEEWEVDKVYLSMEDKPNSSS